MKKAFHIIPILSAILLMSCQQETVSTIKIQEEATEVSHYVPGKAVVKVSAALAEKLEAEGNGDSSLEESMRSACVRKDFTCGTTSNSMSPFL